MNILIVAAHGSRKERANREVIALSARLSAKLASTFDRVEPAFLQFADPLLDNVLESAAMMKPEKIVIFPFFIGSGSHITADIPELVEKAEDRFPDVEFTVTRHLGKLEAIEDVIASEVCSC